MFLQAGEYNIALDGKETASNVNFVSHAHSDHYSGIKRGSTLITSEITKELLEARGKSGLIRIDEPDCVTLLNAGHVLGSKQLFVKNDLYGYTVTYSGDYQVDEPVLAEKIEMRETDALIMDSTYANPEIEFGDKNDAVTSIQHYAKMKLEKGSVIFKAYSLGRSQELIKILNEVGIQPVVDPFTELVNKVYEKHGIKLDYSVCESESLNCGNNFVGIFAGSKIGKIKERLTANGRRIFTAVATGWARYFVFDTDVQFALSDHADFKQAIEYVEACNPKLIFTKGENAKMFARNLVLRGYNARPIDNNSLSSYLM